MCPSQLKPIQLALNGISRNTILNIQLQKLGNELVCQAVAIILS